MFIHNYMQNFSLNISFNFNRGVLKLQDKNFGDDLNSINFMKISPSKC